MRGAGFENRFSFSAKGFISRPPLKCLMRLFTGPCAPFQIQNTCAANVHGALQVLAGSCKSFPVLATVQIRMNTCKPEKIRRSLFKPCGPFLIFTHPMQILTNVTLSKRFMVTNTCEKACVPKQKLDLCTPWLSRCSAAKTSKTLRTEAKTGFAHTMAEQMLGCKN